MKNEFFISLLQEEILKKMNFHKATTSNVEKISDAVEEELNEYLSKSTMQRFFGLVPLTSSLRESTLDILSQFVGYPSWEKFCQSQQDISKQSSQITPDSYSTKLLKMCLKNYHFETVIEFINELPLPYDKDQAKLIYSNANNKPETSLSIVFIAQTLGEFMLKSTKAREFLLPRLAKTLHGQFYFYESYVSDYPFYLEAIEKYYQPHIHTQNSYFGVKDHCFTNSMLFLKSLKENNLKKANKLAKEWFSQMHPEAIEHIDFRPYTRYHLSYVVHSIQSGNMDIGKFDKYVEKFLLKAIEKDIYFLLATLTEIMKEAKTYTFMSNFYENYPSLFTILKEKMRESDSKEIKTERLIDIYSNLLQCYLHLGKENQAYKVAEEFFSNGDIEQLQVKNLYCKDSSERLLFLKSFLLQKVVA